MNTLDVIFAVILGVVMALPAAVLVHGAARRGRR